MGMGPGNGGLGLSTSRYGTYIVVHAAYVHTFLDWIYWGGADVGRSGTIAVCTALCVCLGGSDYTSGWWVLVSPVDRSRWVDLVWGFPRGCMSSCVCNELCVYLVVFYFLPIVMVIWYFSYYSFWYHDLHMSN